MPSCHRVFAHIFANRVCKYAFLSLTFEVTTGTQVNTLYENKHRPLASWMKPITMMIISADTLAMVKIYWTLFVQLTL